MLKEGREYNISVINMVKIPMFKKYTNSLCPAKLSPVVVCWGLVLTLVYDQLIRQTGD